MMMVFGRRAGWAAVLALPVVLLLAGPAAAQENLDSGKTAAQLYASDCAICHKTTSGMSKSAGAFGLQAFLRVHYTASKEAAAAIAAYVEATDHGPAPAHPVKRAAKPKEKAKSSDTKPSETKSSETKSSETKSSDTKSSDTKSSETKSSETKSSESKSSEKASEAKTPAAKPAETGSTEHKPVEAKAEAGKPAKPSEKKPDGDKKQD